MKIVKQKKMSTKIQKSEQLLKIHRKADGDSF